MLSTLKSEFRKLLTIRTTYALVLMVLGFTVLLSYFGTNSFTYDEGVCKTTGEVVLSKEDMLGTGPMPEEYVSPEDRCQGEVVYITKVDPQLPAETVVTNIQESVSMASLFIAIVVVLLVVHEFRFNTITYSLTSSNSRTKFLLAKLVAAITFMVVVSLAVVAVSAVVTHIAINAKGLILPAQDFNWPYLLARILGNMAGFVLIGFTVAVILRNLAASMAALFVLPTLNSMTAWIIAERGIEPTRILPFSALERVGNAAGDLTGSVMSIHEGLTPATVAGASLVGLAYVVGLLLVAWLLFVRRDAS